MDILQSKEITTTPTYKETLKKLEETEQADILHNYRRELETNYDS